ncbi:lyase family protein [Desulforhopalus singaporensis]|uniref:Aspartate ammonia-lyase n=1 Tax=Desulforhopalus singaporensis TaxID=91360 RepID=A0A1H0T6G7_9BACT|nr:lyase family protein [Desulforhopalus singaporensis]SDP49455.1 aspartate ammonia-lyase [Desulforhopalus singaporensis]
MDKAAKGQYYGEETAKALDHLGREQTPSEMVKAYALVKLAAFRAQQESCNLYPGDYFPFLEQVTQGVADGQWDDQFVLPLAQGGAGTSLHMNLCEVIAALANEQYQHRYPDKEFRAHPIEDLARFQSTNDTFPTAVILLTFEFLETVESRIIGLQEALVAKEREYETQILCGRTQLQDALPITLGQVFGGWAGPVERDRWRLHKLKERLRTVPLGGTAIGTGYSAPRDYVFAAERHLRNITGYPLCRSQNLCDQVAHSDSLAETARGMALCADNLFKFSSDLLLYASGFLNEIRHKELQYGSTIMPVKSNPVRLELIRGLSMECASAGQLICDYVKTGQLQLNANLPFISDQMIRLSTRLIRALDTAITTVNEGLVPDVNRMEANLAKSPAILNSLREVLGYARVKQLAPEISKAAPRNLADLKLWLEAHTELTRPFLDQWASPLSLTAMGGGETEAANNITNRKNK